MRLTKIVAIAAVALAGGIATFGTGAGVSALSPADAVPSDPAVPVEPVVASTSQVSLPLLGAPLIVDINSDPGGNLVDVSLNPADGYTATKLKTNNVQFVNDAGTVKVRVKAKRGGLRIDARAASLAEVTGASGWTGDVFGTGETTSVTFTVGATAEGTPDISDVAVDSPITNVVGETTYGGHDDSSESSASARVEFSAAGQTRVLTIRVKVGDDHHRGDDESADTSAKLSISLSKIKGRQIPEGEAVGSHTWSGMLCDGTTATLTYNVAADGAVTDVVANPGTAEVSYRDHSAKVKFAGGERVDISTKTGDSGLTVGAKAKIRCAAAAPDVNTPIDPQATADGEGDHRGERRKDDDHEKRRADRRRRPRERDRADRHDDDRGHDRTATTAPAVTDRRRVAPRTLHRAMPLIAAALLGACASSGEQTEPTGATTIAAASTTIAAASTTEAATVVSPPTSPATVEAAGTVPPTVVAAPPPSVAAPPDPALLLSAGLDRYALGYHFVTIATVNGAVALSAEGDRVGEGTRLTVTTGGSTIEYVVTPESSWVFSDNTWAELDETSPVTDPIGPLRAPLTLEVRSFDGTLSTVAATYPASALAIGADEPIEVLFIFESGNLRSMTYVAPTAEVRAEFSDLVDATPVTVPEV